jgi:TPR repeat protein
MSHGRRGALLGHPLAMVGWASVCDSATEVPLDKAEADRYYRHAAAQSELLLRSLEGRATYGDMLLNGHGVQKDFDRGMQLVRQAAEDGDTGAMESVACALIVGINLPRDFAEAARWLRRGAEEGGDMRAAMALALVNSLEETEKGDGDVSVSSCNLEQAVALLRKAIAKDMPSAYFELADVLFQRYLQYRNELEEDSQDRPLPPGMEADLREAIALARRAVELGVHEGHLALGVMYLLGALPVLQADLAAAARELHLAVGYDIPAAEYFLGRVYQAQRNMTEARRWLRRAADNGHLLAIQSLQKEEL